MKRFITIMSALFVGLVLSQTAFAKSTCHKTQCKPTGSKSCFEDAQATYMKKRGLCTKGRARCYKRNAKSCYRKCGGRSGRRNFRCYNRCKQKGFRRCYKWQRRCHVKNAKNYKKARRACGGTQRCCEKDDGSQVCSPCQPNKPKVKRKKKRNKKRTRKVARKSAEDEG